MIAQEGKQLIILQVKSTGETDTLGRGGESPEKMGSGFSPEGNGSPGVCVSRGGAVS